MSGREIKCVVVYVRPKISGVIRVPPLPPPLSPSPPPPHVCVNVYSTRAHH